MAAKTLVLLHGVGQSPTSWQDVITAVATMSGRQRMRAPWLPGLRPKDRGVFSIDVAAGDIARTLELDADGPVLLCGQSLGAMVALRLAVQFPDLVDELVLIAPQINPPKAALFAQRMALKLIPASKFAAEGISKERLMSTLKELSRIDLRDDLGRISCPVTVAVGASDRLNKSHSAMIAEKLSTSVVELPGGEAPNVEAPTQLAQLLCQRWLNEGDR